MESYSFQSVVLQDGLIPRNMAGLTAECNAPIAGVKILITLVNILGLKGISLIKQPDEYIYPEPQLKLN